jgi:sulfide:quinone oxidoreductase
MLLSHPRGRIGNSTKVEGREMVAESQRVVVAGAGVAGLEVALALRELAGDLVTVEIVAPEHEFVYRPLAVLEPFRMGDARRFPVRRLVEAAGATLRQDAVVALDAEDKGIRLQEAGWVDYDIAVFTLGAQPVEAVPGALTFRGPEDRHELEAILDRVVGGELRRLSFALPAASPWPLPLYELALLTSEFLVEHLTRGVELALVTQEARPLELFGEQASDAVARLLELRRVRFEGGAAPRAWRDGVLKLADGTTTAADAVVALPLLRGAPLEGLPQDENGFVATDELGAVVGLTDVYAAGDLTQAPVKQGGIAAQQADRVAAAIAIDLGACRTAELPPTVLRGLLLTGSTPQYIRAEADRPTVMSSQPLWWPPAKIAGRHLGPFLASHLGLADASEPTDPSALPVEVHVPEHAPAAPGS